MKKESSNDTQKRKIMSQSNPGLLFTFLNSDGKPAIYITSNADLNKIVFSLKNNTGNIVSLKGGDLPKQNPPPADGPAVIYFAFSDPKLNAALTIGNDQWHFSLVNSDGIKLWCLTPKQDITLADGDEIKFNFGGLTADGQIPDVQFYYEWYNFATVPDGGNTLTIAIIPPPDKNLKKLNIGRGFIDSNIYVNENPGNTLNNYLQFFLNNASNESLVAKSTPWEAHDPVFDIYFEFANKLPGYGALTTVALAKQINISEQYSGLWCIDKHSQGQSVSFSLRPKAKINHEILGTYENASAQFIIGPIETSLVTGITNMRVAYKNIPGYQAGIYSIPIFKNKPTPGILNFLAYPASVHFQEYVSLSWQTMAVHAIELHITANNNTTILKSLDGTISLNESDFQIQCDSKTGLTLLAFDKNNKLVDEQQRDITVLLPNPEIEFNARPRLQYSKQGVQAESVELSWNVKYADKNDGVTLNPSVTRKIFPSAGSFVYENPVAGPITLTAIKSIPDSEQVLSSKATVNLVFPNLPLKPVKTIDITSIIPDSAKLLYRGFPMWSGKNGIFVSIGDYVNNHPSLTIYHFDYGTNACKQAFKSSIGTHVLSADHSQLFVPLVDSNGISWNLHTLNNATNIYELQKKLNVHQYKSTRSTGITFINNNGTVLFGLGQAQIDSKGIAHLPIAFYGWIGNQFKLLGENVLTYSKEKALAIRHGKYYSEESGKVYFIPFHNDLYIIEPDASFRVISLTGYDLDQEDQLQGMHVSERLNMIFIYSITQGGGFVVFDLRTGALIKTFLHITPNLLSFSDNGIIGGMGEGLGLMIPDDLPHADFKLLFTNNKLYKFSKALIQPDLTRITMMSFEGRKVNLIFYEL